MKCLSQPEVQRQDRENYLVGAFRNLLLAGTPADLREASALIEGNLQHFQNCFDAVSSLFTFSEGNSNEPISFFQADNDD